MSDEKKVEGGTLWNTPAGSLPSPFAQLDMKAALAQLTPEEMEKIRREADEALEKDPVYQSFKRGAEESRRWRDPTVYWNKHSRYGR